MKKNKQCMGQQWVNRHFVYNSCIKTVHEYKERRKVIRKETGGVMRKDECGTWESRT